MAEPTPTANVIVDWLQPRGPLRRIWTSLGYDEFNWTATPRGLRNLSVIQSFAEAPYTVRAHNIYTSGSGHGLPHWSSGNIYHEDAGGRPYFDWSIADQVFDAWVHHGFRPIVELGFCPKALVPADAAFPFTPMPSLYSTYEAGLWAWPPSDFERWGILVSETVLHFLDRYGHDVVTGWYWEVWNEPDISYWQGTVEEYCSLYDITVAAITEIMPDALVGGPATTGGGSDFLAQFLDHCASGVNAVTGGKGSRLDFVSFHTKGAAFHPWRTYGPMTADGTKTPVKASPSTKKMLWEIRSGLAVIDCRPAFEQLPVLVDECDASVPAHWGVYDNANFGYRNTAYYPVFQLQLMKKILDLDRLHQARVDAATTWSWYFEGDRFFEGTRSLFTAGDLGTPLVNAYRMLARLGDQRLHVASTAGRESDQLDDMDSRAEVDGLAAWDNQDRITVLIWHHCDDQFRSEEVMVTVSLRNIPFEGRPLRLRHFRIDHSHSNSHSVWVGQGRPQTPDPDQLNELTARSGLETVEADRLFDRAPKDLMLSFSLPLPGASLLEVEAQ